MVTVEGLPNFRRGVLPIVILSLLKREDMYGYQLVQETQRCSGGDLTTQEGSWFGSSVFLLWGYRRGAPRVLPRAGTRPAPTNIARTAAENVGTPVLGCPYAVF